MLTSETFSVLRPFTATVASNGQASLIISHNLAGIIWQIFQIGLALNKAAPSPQVGAHFNGIPLTATVTMQAVTLPGAPYAMESFIVGPPYIGLKAGDQLVCAVLGATAGDVFTAGAYLSEEVDPNISPAVLASWQGNARS